MMWMVEIMRSVIGAKAATAATELVPPFCTPSPNR